MKSDMNLQCNTVAWCLFTFISILCHLLVLIYFIFLVDLLHFHFVEQSACGKY